jgi:hypothetical protein
MTTTFGIAGGASQATTGNTSHAENSIKSSKRCDPKLNICNAMALCGRV